MKNKIFLFCSILFLFPNRLSCTIGCMDNSFHMERKRDFKNYHYVRCECPCTDVMNERGICRRCFHKGNPRRGEINSMQLMNPISIYR